MRMALRTRTQLSSEFWVEGWRDGSPTGREGRGGRLERFFCSDQRKTFSLTLQLLLKSSLFRRKHSRKSEAVTCTAVMCSLAMAFLEKVRVRRAQSALPGGEASSREHGHFSTHRALHPSGAQKADSE